MGGSSVPAESVDGMQVTGFNGESEPTGTEPTGTEPGDGESSHDESAPQRYDLGDLDGNGETEYLMISVNQGNSIVDGHLSFYWNGESIYEYDDILLMHPGAAEYIDLDGDGEKELFFTFYPYVNSMPLIEYAVLKQTNGGWKALEMIHGETMLDNEFPISCRYGKAKNTMVLTCEGLDKEIVYNFKDYYEDRIRETRESGGDVGQYNEILNGNHYAEGDDFGEIAAWGIWDINSGIYEGRNCLIATHGLEGALGKWDMMGEIDICFDYDADGMVRILDMEFRDYLSAKGNTTDD